MALDDYLTTSEVAALKGVSVEHLARLIRQDQLPATKKGGIWLIHKPDLDALDAIAQPPTEEPLPEKAFILVKDQPIPLTSAWTRLGRDLTNDIVVNNPSVSRFHAEVHYNESRFLIRDLGSSGGTFVNGNQVSEAPLFAGDSIRLASAPLTFMAPSASLTNPAEDQTLLIRRPKPAADEGEAGEQNTP
ncbi:MAG: FHA domain-containing protein [Chloroflexi bacterium]|nr:MAG: FHA domain-containing protein [Chloroflexota bacterium]MBL1193096.1 FHA domain-containing protein [Chloroflexota bacterium]NOH10389.1 FHA domain-containing protein [Chloroflexota bacterium]